MTIAEDVVEVLPVLVLLVHRLLIRHQLALVSWKVKVKVKVTGEVKVKVTGEVKVMRV